jgi:hypothetical protein
MVEGAPLRELGGVQRLPDLSLFALKHCLAEDLTPLLECPSPAAVEVTGNPLSAESYHDVLPELRRRAAGSPPPWSTSGPRAGVVPVLVTVAANDAIGPCG